MLTSFAKVFFKATERITSRFQHEIFFIAIVLSIEQRMIPALLHTSEVLRSCGVEMQQLQNEINWARQRYLIIGEADQLQVPPTEEQREKLNE